MATLKNTKIDDTGHITMPVGTTAQRPGSPATGDFRYNSDDEQFEIYDGITANDWIPLAGGGGGLSADLATLNSSLSGFSYNQVSSIKSAIENLGYTLIATPTYGAMAESQSGTTNITSIGQFNYSEFDSGATLANSEGFSNNSLNGYPFMGFAGFGPSGFAGTAAMMYRDYSSAALRDFFSPNQDRNLYCYVLNADGSTVEDDSGNTSTIYSDGHFPGSNGYNSTSRFAQDDGSWGFSIGTTRLDGNGGPYLQNSPSNSYGCENRNSGDTNGDEFFWGGQTDGITNYCFYFFIKRA